MNKPRIYACLVLVLVELDFWTLRIFRYLYSLDVVKANFMIWMRFMGVSRILTYTTQSTVTWIFRNLQLFLSFTTNFATHIATISRQYLRHLRQYLPLLRHISTYKEHYNETPEFTLCSHSISQETLSIVTRSVTILANYFSLVAKLSPLKH